ncbi:ankyrin repeat-containing domain [Cordyceps militaris CM01]|uniref:Ankyrin repeat-containing domain n=1 Tax=Cordyceps militaris (strain CM01) TaxID=983644 RepID=G3JMX4_CORMM|nr:ankyrin repeat-containing domain [Cordyceps militaris CM01]EGX90156.1 ankyrin repeat-containing domain [Cordyceps militaris CM01]
MAFDGKKGTGIGHLPDHLLLEIGGWLRVCSNLYALILTSRRFHNLFEKELYRLDTSGTRFSKSLLRVSECDYVLVNKLTKFGCSLDVSCRRLSSSGEEMTALVRAMRKNHFGLAAVLALAGANVDKAPNASNIPVFMALEEKTGLDIFKMLITVGNADLTVLNEKGHGLLTAASSNDNIEAVRYLLSYPSRLNVKNTEKSTPFHQAIRNDNFDMLLLLLNSQYTYPNMPDEHNTTALELACTLGRLDHVHALLDDIRSAFGFPYHWGYLSSKILGSEFS